jgi:hypothetical protein
MKRFCILSVCIFFFTLSLVSRNQSLPVTVFGLQPGGGQNALVAVRQALDYCAEHEISTLTFPQGRYDFWIDSVSNQSTGMILDHICNLHIDGNGSLFVFHGLMSICGISHSSGIRMSNFSVDWDRPYISQGEIVVAESDWLDIKIDKQAYPYIIRDERIVFLGEGWEKGVEWYNLYDKDSKEIVYRTLDMPLGNNLFTRYPVREISEGRIRIFARLPFLPDAGTFITLWHGRYLKNGISITESKDTVLENINVYHALSNGILGFRSENIRMDNVNMTVNEKKGRVFSLIADAMHFNTCKGSIRVENCCHTGQGDDFINVHGMNIQTTGIADEYSVDIPPSGKNSSRNTIREGDEMWLINQKTLQRGETRIIHSITGVYEKERLTGYRIRFNKKLPKNLSAGDVLENKTWFPDVGIRRCRILKKHRARGILVSTPGKVRIENNYFRSAGTAILIEGDIDYWYESGACRDVLIAGNVFEDCYTSDWGKGVITITPSHRPDSEYCPAYHSHIRISGNLFKHFDATLLYARSVKNLLFSENEIATTYTYKPYGEKYGFFFEGCRETIVKNNRYAGDFSGKTAVAKHCAPRDVRIYDKEITITTE